MSQKICIVESVNELKFVLNNIKQNIIYIPLDLQTHLYCEKKKLNFYNPIRFIDSNFHRKALVEAEKLIDKLDLSSLKHESHKKMYKVKIRFEINSAIYLIEIIEKINALEKIDEIIVSGWTGEVAQDTTKKYLVSYLIYNLINDIKIVKLSENFKKTFTNSQEKKYVISNKNLDRKKNYILQNSLGYNFWKIIFFLKKNYYILVPIFQEQKNQSLLRFIKKKILRLLKVVFVEYYSYPKDDQSKIFLPKTNFFYKGKDLSKVINIRFVQSLTEFKNMCEAIDTLFDEFNIKFVLSNMAIGVDEYYLEKSKKKNIPSIYIPHGSVSEHYNEYDKIFKNQIAESQFTKLSDFFSIQSKIAKNFIQSNKIDSKCIETGNLLFANSKNIKKNKIIFAVTLKSFEGIKYLGIEMYYEFLENLSLLNEIAGKKKLKFIVKPHPSINACFYDLKEKFKNLEFTKEKIDNVLKHAMLTISFSSTVIEDSLYSNVPVILFDRWKRYKHCKAEEDITKKNAAVYYVNNENDLVDCIDTIGKSDEISFKEYIFEGTVKKNMENLVSKFLNT